MSRLRGAPVDHHHVVVEEVAIRVPVAIVVDATPFETEADDVREETTLTRQVPLVELVERRVDVVRIERDATRRQSIVAELDDHEQLAFESRSWVPAADDVARQREAFAPYRQHGERTLVIPISARRAGSRQPSPGR